MTGQEHQLSDSPDQRIHLQPEIIIYSGHTMRTLVWNLIFTSLCPDMSAVDHPIALIGHYQLTQLSRDDPFTFS